MKQTLFDVCILLAWLLITTCDKANADTFLHMRSTSHCVTTGGTSLDLPVGYYFDEPAYDTLNVEVKRLQDSETSLKAQNDDLRKSLDSWQPGIYTIGIAAVVGIAAGFLIAREL